MVVVAKAVAAFARVTVDAVVEETVKITPPDMREDVAAGDWIAQTVVVAVVGAMTVGW